jgi:hypothetical protein
MADYKELLRRAISALPENNGAARRAVYEKARSALVGQLRAITPPLPARDITQHRLQLEDCIRQVEQEASESVITLGRDAPLPPPRAAEPAAPPPVETAKPARAEKAEKPAKSSEPAKIIEPAKVAEAPKVIMPAVARTEPKLAIAPKPEAADKLEAARPDRKGKPKPGMSIEDIIAQAAATTGAEVASNDDVPSVEPVPALVRGPISAVPPSNVRPFEAPLKAPSFEPRRDGMALAANSSVEPLRADAMIGNQALARQPAIVPVETALSSIREVELESPRPDTREAEGAIERAIEALDREARGEQAAPLPESTTEANAFAIAPPPGGDVEGFVDPAPAAARSGHGLTIFLVVFALLLAGVGGAGFWAWREGFVDLDQMFGQSPTIVAETPVPVQPTSPTMEPAPVGEAETLADVAVGPGNTAPTVAEEPAAALESLVVEDRLEPTPEPVVPTGTETTLPSLETEEPKTEERLTDETAVAAADDPAASVDPAVLAGSQSLLLEASADGRTGAVPFSGTVEWSEGTDELGQPTLIGRANIPARSLAVNLTIRKNTDPILPASHLMEVDFVVSDSFIGGAISSLPGVLLKDQELVPGTPLVGASARIVGNSFLFALSASETDETVNTNLLQTRRWMDLAVVYGTGRNAILTLEKDDEAQALFERVFGTWAES